MVATEQLEKQLRKFRSLSDRRNPPWYGIVGAFAELKVICCKKTFRPPTISHFIKRDI